MIDLGKHNVLGVAVNAIDYEAAVQKIISAAHTRKPLSVTALAVHGVMTGALDKVHRHRLNTFDLVVPDGQPVRWAMRLLFGIKLPDRVYGPTLTLKVCERAAEESLPIYLYGSKPEVLQALQQNLLKKYPKLKIAGAQPSRFRTVDKEEQAQIAAEIRASGAAIVFAGLGCPRQEVWAYENRNLIGLPILAVGAAFDFHAGLLSQAPKYLQDVGLEWLYRFTREPKRLWKRYVLLNPAYLGMLALQATKIKHYDLNDVAEPQDIVGYA